ncbi:MAG: TrmH family RNA methyltransferase [Thermaceae bacterium]
MRIESPQNPKIKALAALKEKRERTQTGLFVVEGFREVRRALEAGLKPRILLLGPRAKEEEWALAQEAEEVWELSEAALGRVSSRENPAQVLAVFPIPQKDPRAFKLPPHPLVLAVVGVEKPGNLGAILRSADAAGVDLVLLAEGTDLYSPQVIRNSTGVLFHLPILPLSQEAAFRFLEEKGLFLVAATPQGERAYWEEDYRQGVAFLVGAEDEGLPEAWLRRAHARVRIPMKGRADSLNVSVSAALLLYEALRQRWESPLHSPQSVEDPGF